MKRYDEAEAAFRKAMELDPNDSFYYNNLSNVLRLLGREEEALRFAEDAQRLDPHDADYLLPLVFIHKKLGHETESRQYAAQIRELLGPDDWYNRACLESICGNADAAIESLRQAARRPKFDREWARLDPDLEWIRDDPRFKEIVGEEGA